MSVSGAPSCHQRRGGGAGPRGGNARDRRGRSHPVRADRHWFSVGSEVTQPLNDGRTATWGQPSLPPKPQACPPGSCPAGGGSAFLPCTRGFQLRQTGTWEDTAPPGGAGAPSVWTSAPGTCGCAHGHASSATPPTPDPRASPEAVPCTLVSAWPVTADPTLRGGDARPQGVAGCHHQALRDFCGPGAICFLCSPGWPCCNFESADAWKGSDTPWTSCSPAPSLPPSPPRPNGLLLVGRARHHSNRETQTGP